ncbi:MAG: dihydropteroate synthase [Treponema sp.]|nr:dihydropteroate synthase [Treponema sp.]
MLELTAGRKKITTDKPAFIMGILNATPDSFYEKSRCKSLDSVFEMIESGADIIDIGGESTRPGYQPVSAKEEIDRILPFVKEIRKHSDIPISIDTTKFEVMKAATEEGADILNDISALEESPELAAYCAQNNLSLVLMHRFPSEHEKEADYENVIDIVKEYLKNRINFALSAGIKKERIILDPGIGFGKSSLENQKLIKECSKITDDSFTILMALSRKRCIGEMTGESLESRLAGTLAANLFSVLNGAKILRVHDIKETRDILNIAKNML